MDTCKGNLYSSFFQIFLQVFPPEVCVLLWLTLYLHCIHVFITRDAPVLIPGSGLGVGFEYSVERYQLCMYVDDSFVTAVKPAEESSSSNTTSVEK